MLGKYPNKGVQKEIFMDYLDLPYLITEQLMKIMDPTSKGYIGIEEFTYVLSTLAWGDLAGKMSLVFQM